MDETIKAKIGIGLMIMITVILAAVIAAFVFSLADAAVKSENQTTIKIEAETDWPSMQIIPKAYCQDKVVCYVVVNHNMIADNGGGCFYNETELLRQYCGS